MAIYRGPGGAGDATNDATSQAILAAESAQQAAASAAAASASASQAATSATNSASSATASANSATTATTEASNAATSATNAANSASTATTKAAEASTSATNAAASESAAASSATAAASSAASASNSATLATTKASEASTSATSAASSANAAAASATTASTQATNASNSATAAATSETNAANSATAATTSATNAANSATTATTQATNAASSATAAATSASNAATSATNASNSASAAATSATNASNSASAASTSATNAANSATAAAASYDSFDDRYLGSKTSNPTLDNDGNALLTGALYWNSTVGEMRVYNGSAWVAAYVPAATYVAKAGDVMTGSLEVPTQASLKATTLTRASIRPSLLLDFANTKQLDPRITFSRPTTATYYDGKTTAVAEQNLLTYSQDFTNSVWSKIATSITANYATAPDGTNTAARLVGNDSSWYMIQSTGSPLSQSYVFSVYVKSNTASSQNFRLFISGGPLSSDLTATTSWQRFTLSFTGPGTSVAIARDSLNNTADLQIWGAHLEQRSTVTAYTPTTTAPITNYIPALQTAAAGVPRFDHDPITGESKGLLIEEQRTNLFLRSQEFNTTWFMGAGGTGAITADQTIAPDGTLSADLLYDLTTANNYRVIEQDISLTSASSYSISCFVKAAGNGFAYLRVGQATTGNNIIVYFNLNSGIVGTSNRFANTNSPTIVSSGIRSVGNSWYRISVEFTANVTASHYCQIGMSNADNAFSYVGNGFSGIFLWGAQLEAGSFATSYIPTVASQVTRSADSASMTGSNFSSWYRADEGTIYAEAIFNGKNSGGNQFFAIGDGTLANRVNGSLYNDRTNLYIGKAGSTQASIYGASVQLNTTTRASFAYKTDLTAVTSGGTISEDTNCLIPDINRLEIGFISGTNAVLNGTIKRIAYWPKRLSNTELQGLTS